MAAKDHLRPRPPWPKGTSGNPKGRPKGPRATRITDCLLEQLGTEDVAGRSNSDRIAAVAIRKAIKGDLGFVAYVTDRTDGKVTGKLELTGSDGGPLEFADARSRLLGRLARKPAGDPPDPQ